MLSNITKIPLQEWNSCRGVGWDYILVESEVGDGGFFDGVGIVRLGIADGEVLDMTLGIDSRLVTC